MVNIMNKIAIIFLALLVTVSPAFSFCGFYVAKAEAQLFNEQSSVIIARHDGQTVITMSNDFKGPLDEFAMVVPVPEVLTKDRIRIADQKIFDKLDAYSGPRIVEYNDPNPCQPMYALEEMSTMRFKSARNEAPAADMVEDEKDYGVQIVESYTVGEYDILILSANESNGLERWLIDNDYKIPVGAQEVLEPYIKNDMKFFVVKVNLKKAKQNGYNTLRPIQMTFQTDKFMLPIRLGMANAKGNQDLIVYSLTKKGMTEATNYKTTKIPTNKEIPEFVEARFGEFYVDLFDKTWKQDKDAVYVEYGWDLSSNNFVKCDPCVTNPPVYADLREAGIFWVDDNTQRQFRTTADYNGDVYLTRLHVRYNRSTFPQDLKFQETPNKESFQGRYVMNHPAQGDLTCDAGKNYLKDVVKRRTNELENLADLTGWNTQGEYAAYVGKYEKMIDKNYKKDNDSGTDENGFIKALPKKGAMLLIGTIANGGGSNGPEAGMFIMLYVLCLTAFSWYWIRQGKLSVV